MPGAISDSTLAEKLHAMRQTKREALKAADEKLQLA